MIAEPWNTLLFLVVIPLVIQLFKLYQDKTGKTLGKLANQMISLVISFVFCLLSGGFAGLTLPALPVWGGDLIAFIGLLLVFLAAWMKILGAGWGSLMVIYELVWDRLFTKFGAATRDKYIGVG